MKSSVPCQTFTASGSRSCHKAAKLAAFELQISPANPGLQCHRLDNIKDKNVWSARASRDLRLIFHRVESSVMLCYVGHHDPAYDWASRRRIETHPVTGAAQIVEIRKTVRENQIPLHVAAEPAATAQTKWPLSNLTEADLLSYGVPAEWIPDVRTADDDMLLVIASHLPGEAAVASPPTKSALSVVSTRLTSSEIAQPRQQKRSISPYA